MTKFQKLKWYIVRHFFKDVMDANSRRYLHFNRFPVEGIKECYNVAKNRLIDELKEELDNGNFSKNIVDPIFDFYVSLMIYDYSSLAIGIAREANEVISDFEKQNTNVLINKEKLYFLIALLNTTSGNTMTSTTYWELTIKESSRVNGTNVNINQIINQMPSGFTSLLNAVKIRHNQNPVISNLKTRYAFINDFEINLSQLTNLSLLSFLSSGIRNVHINTLFDEFNQSVDVVKMYAQELINNLCVLNEAELKNNINIQTLIPDPKDRMIGNMLQKISQFNSGVHAVLGNSYKDRLNTFRVNGLYINASISLSDENNFNLNYRHYIQTIESNTLSDDELKAYILYGLHNIRNKVLHNLNPNLVYYNDTNLFLKTIGLLFASISVIRSL